MISVNREAKKIVDKILEQAEQLNVIVSTLKNGTTVVDMGQKAKGSWLAGKYYAEITMGGMGEVTFDSFQLDEYTLPSVKVTSANPFLAGWVSQKHADPLPGAENQPILAGPAKALLKPPDASIVYANYHDNSDIAVAPFQTSAPITEDFANWVADACQLNPKNLYILVAPSNSLVCAIQVAARPIDNLMHRLHEEGIDIHQVSYAFSSSPVPPLAEDELEAMGRINDSMLYGGQVLIYLNGNDPDIQRILPNLPTRSSNQYGKTFRQIFVEHDMDFHKIDLRIHSVALVQINNIATGNCFSAGAIDRGMLRKSFLGKD